MDILAVFKWRWSRRLTASNELKIPSACSQHEFQGFERLVRLGFRGSDAGLPRRIRRAHLLAFCYEPCRELVGIGGLKVPELRYRERIFQRAGVAERAPYYSLELGWVFVSHRHRGTGIGSSVCDALLARVPGEPVFATTRPDNAAMARILKGRRFTRAGSPFPRRSERLTLYLRS